MHKRLITLLLFSTLCFSQDTRKKIVILDTGIEDKFPKQYLCTEGSKDFTGFGLNDRIKHGTHIAYIISEYMNPDEECLIILKFYDQFAASQGLFEAYKYLRTLDIKFLNLSFGGKDYFPSEKETLKELLDKDVIISVAAGNKHIDLTKKCEYFPACHDFENDNFKVVGSCKDGKYEYYSNYGDPPVKYCQNGTKVEAGGYVFTGTSQSTGIMTGILVKRAREDAKKKKN